MSCFFMDNQLTKKKKKSQFEILFHFNVFYFCREEHVFFQKSLTTSSVWLSAFKKQIIEKEMKFSHG